MSAASGRQRADVSRNGTDVFVGQLGNRSVRQPGRRPAVVPILEVKKLADDIKRVLSGDTWYFSQAAQIRTVTNAACNGSAPAAGLDEIFSFFETARRYVGDKTGTRITALVPERVFGNAADPFADRFHGAVWSCEALVVDVQVRLRDHSCFDHLVPHAGLQGGRVFACFAELLIGKC